MYTCFVFATTELLTGRLPAAWLFLELILADYKQ